MIRWTAALLVLPAALLSQACAEVADIVPQDLGAEESPDDFAAEGEPGDEEGDLACGDEPDAALPDGDEEEGGGQEQDDPSDEEAGDPAGDLPADPDVVEDVAPEVEVEPDIPGIGVPVCDAASSVTDCGLLCLTPRRYSHSVVLPAVGVGRVVRFQAQISPRWIFLEKLPFDDLEISLVSPGGIRRKLWNRFNGGDSWGSNFTFPDTWELPVWWDESMTGTWTLEILDHMFSGADTQIASWCVTPLAPWLYSTHDPFTRLSRCYSSSFGIRDYCDGDAPDPCTTHPRQAEIQVTDLVKASGAPVLTVNLTHPATSELVLVVKGPGGTDVTVWDRGSGAMPSSFTITAMNGVWMTGRWGLEVTDRTQGNVGTVSSWCVEAN